MRDGPAGEPEVVGELADRREAVAAAEAASEYERCHLLAQLLVRGDRRARIDLEDHDVAAPTANAAHARCSR
jgi:hypothetical protein